MRDSYTGKGRLNKSVNMDFINICKMDQMNLKKFLGAELKKYYRNVISQDGFLYVKGKDKIAVTAHMDTVHHEQIKTFNELHENGLHIVSSPQGIGGDDRCGIYMILEILKRTKFRPTIVFCEDEEIGGVGSDKFTKTNFMKNLEKMYFMIELDRRGNNDVVFYNDENKEFHRYVEKVTGYKENWGSFSDISNLAPVAGVSAVNISCGYHNEHTTDEYVVIEEMENSIKTVIKLIKEGLKDKKQYEYIEEIGYFNDYNYGYPYSNIKKFTKNDVIDLYVEYDGLSESGDDYIQANDLNEAFVMFFQTHPTISWNEITNWEYWNESDLYSAM